MLKNVSRSSLKIFTDLIWYYLQNNARFLADSEKTFTCVKSGYTFCGHLPILQPYVISRNTVSYKHQPQL